MSPVDSTSISLKSLLKVCCKFCFYLLLCYLARNHNIFGDAGWKDRILGGKVVKKHLPRSQPAQHLVEVNMPERRFQENQTSLLNMFFEKRVAGVYETKTSLSFRAIMQLGCCCRVIPQSSSQSSSSTSGFDLDQLEMVPSASENYLTGDSLRTIYLYHSSTKNGNLGIVGVFVGGSGIEDNHHL